MLYKSVAKRGVIAPNHSIAEPNTQTLFEIIQNLTCKFPLSRAAKRPYRAQRLARYVRVPPRSQVYEAAQLVAVFSHFPRVHGWWQLRPVRDSHMTGSGWRSRKPNFAHDRVFRELDPHAAAQQVLSGEGAYSNPPRAIPNAKSQARAGAYS